MNGASGARYRLRMGRGFADLSRTLALRQKCFRPEHPTRGDQDALDAVCQHMLVEDLVSGDLAGCCRILLLHDSANVAKSYSALHYDLSALARHPGPLLEIGRFCIAPGVAGPDILRAAWAGLARIVDQAGAQLLFGCTSFRGLGIDDHRAAMALLAAEHLAPERWRPRRKAAEIRDFADFGLAPPDPRQAFAAMPPLLRSYLAMGGWVSDHAVIDRDLNTLHVFTALEVAAIPAARARALRAAAAGISGP